ncbi:MAG: HlyD family efflux transporter periplasmic adaptor subunit [Bryobacterales bacterium]
MKWRKRIGWIIALLAVVMAIGYGFLPQPVLVDSAQVGRGLLRVTVREEGRTRVVDRYVISAPVTGYVQRVRLNVGDAVGEGQIVARLEPLRSTALDPRSRAEAEARVETAQASLTAAEESTQVAAEDARYAETEMGRMQALFDTGTIAREQLDRAETEARRTQANLETSRANVNVAERELEAARVALKDFAAERNAVPAAVVPVRAPTAGRVLKRFRESEGVVNAGESLVEVGSPRTLEVEVEALSSDAVRLSPGTRVLFERWGGDYPLEGIVRTVEPFGFTKISALGVEEQRVLVIVDFTSPREQWERLGDGYRVEAVFILWEGEQVLQVPSSALFRVGDGWAVFAIAEGKAARRGVEVGHRSGLTAEIVSGLDEGQRVITHPSNDIEDGTEVTIREE